MSTTLSDTYGSAWQLSTLGVGAVVTGLGDVKQCIDFILRTRKGQDPFRPLFGSNIFDWVDKPITIARPNIAKEIIDALGMWEQRISVAKVRSDLDTNDIAHLRFYITYNLVDQSVTDTYIFSVTGETQSSAGQLILQAIIPAKVNDSDTWFIDFVGNGNAAVPPFPPEGFSDTSSLMLWLQTNWAIYGSWYLTGNKIILYLKEGIFTTASLNCVLNTSYTLVATIPDITDIEEYYVIYFNVNGVPVTPFFPDGIMTKGDLLTWVQNNWGQYGDWSISNSNLVLTAKQTINGSLSVNTLSTKGGFTIGFSKGFNA